MAASEQRYRQPLRLKSYDYGSHGAYFVTIVAQNRTCLFGTIQDETIALSSAGEMLQSIWQTLPARFPGIILDASVIMPNHFHGIIVFPATNQFVKDDISAVGAPLVGAPPSSAITDNAETEQKVPTRGTPTERPTLGTVVGAWKSLTTVAYITGVKTRGWQRFAGQLWQRNYYEHIVRDDDDLARIRYYIVTNPRYWSQDAENPHLVS